MIAAKIHTLYLGWGGGGGGAGGIYNKNTKMTVFAFWFDSNIEQHYPLRELYAGRVFINDIHDPGQFLYIVVPDNSYIFKHAQAWW